MECKVVINNGKTAVSPAVLDGVEWSTARKGSAGKLSFSIMKDGSFELSEGAGVSLIVDGRAVFCGYLFGRRYYSDGVISLVAYDQLRYFKNRDTYVYSGKTASQVLKMIAADYSLKTGEIADAGYIIPRRVEDNETLFDIVENALDITLQNTGRAFVLYDDCGRLALKDVADMVVRDGDRCLLLDEDAIGGYEFSSGIDNTANRVKLVRYSQKYGVREVFTAEDSGNVKAWGVLQHFGKLTADDNGKALASTLLKLYNAKSRTLRLYDAVGDIRVRGGSAVGVMLPTDGSDGAKKPELMLVESAVHVFKENEHLMNLTLSGGEENG